MRTKNKLTICDYIAEKAPNEAFEVLEESGYAFEKPSSKRELALLLKKYVALDKEDALKKLAAIHPDRELIQDLGRSEAEVSQAEAMFGQGYNNPFNKTPFRVGAPMMMNANGCGCGSMGFNANGGGCGGGCGCGCGGRCGAMAFNGFNANGCGCGGRCGQSNFNADGAAPAKDYTPLVLTLGILTVMYMVLSKK